MLYYESDQIKSSRDRYLAQTDSSNADHRNNTRAVYAARKTRKTDRIIATILLSGDVSTLVGQTRRDNRQIEEVYDDGMDNVKDDYSNTGDRLFTRISAPFSRIQNENRDMFQKHFLFQVYSSTTTLFCWFRML